jgi:antitoxin HicB
MSAKRKVGTATAAGDPASYIAGPFVRMIIPNAEEGNYLAEVLELPGCITEGETPEEAYRNLEEAMAAWIGTSLDNNRPIPEPVGAKEYSGNFPLRISTELHRAAALRAIQEEVSLNQWIARAIAAQVAKESLVNNLAYEVAEKVVKGITLRLTAGLRLELGAVLDVGAPTASDFITSDLELAMKDAYTNAVTSMHRALAGTYAALGPIEQMELGKEVVEDA